MHYQLYKDSEKKGKRWVFIKVVLRWEFKKKNKKVRKQENKKVIKKKR